MTSAQGSNILCACDQEEPPPLGALAETARVLREVRIEAVGTRLLVEIEAGILIVRN